MTTIVVIEIWPHYISVGAICFEDRFCASKKVGQGEMGGSTALADSAWRLLQLTIEWDWSELGSPFCFLVQTNVENRSFHLVRAPFLAFQADFSLEECSSDGGP